LLTGFSQGGHATLAAQRALEAEPVDGIRIAASASIAGPFDLATISFPFALEGGSTASSTYLAFLVDSYANIYGEVLASALTDERARTIPELFDGTHDADAVMAALPTKPREMFRGEFLDAYASGRPNWLRERLAENSLSDWTPQAPIRLYFGSNDVDVSPREAVAEAQRLRARGADAISVDLGPFDHNASILAAVPQVREWFDTLSASANP